MNIEINCPICLEFVSVDTQNKVCLNCNNIINASYIWNDYLQDVSMEAVSLKRIGKYNEAIKVYQELDKKYPNNPNIYYGLAKIFACNGAYDSSLESFKIAKELYEFYDNENGKARIYDCEIFIYNLENLNRNSREFLDFLKSISGDMNYKIKK